MGAAERQHYKVTNLVYENRHAITAVIHDASLRNEWV